MAQEVLMAMPIESLFTNPDPPISRSRSILSFFSNPLGKHTRNIFELAIEPEDPFRVYSPGQTVKGHISLTVLKGFDITHLVVALHGYAKVYKHQTPPGEGVRAPEGLTNGQGSRGVQYRGNGLISLFQQEQVLCGNGFLKKQRYQFAFEVAFPTKSLPSTIDFERGTIRYMLTASVTRPTTIAPVTTRSTKIKFQDLIDIQPLSTPKSRVVVMEPVSKRGKVKVVKPASSVTTQAMSSTGTARSSLTRNNTQNSNASRSNSATIPPLSPALSEETMQTNGTATSSPSFHPPDNGSPRRRASPQNSDARSNTTSSSNNTITVTAELPRHGALAGDSVPIRVSVAHTKGDARGVVIATLYRLSRIDMHPPLPLPSKSGKEKRNEYEDVYPKSRTGLGSLYFSAASPNSAFRKDLTQASTIIVINPATLSADITTSLKVPDSAFPTIANVPGGMISFTYHVEVVVDLFGKMGETRLWPRLTSSEPTFSQTSNPDNSITSNWSNSIMETAALRRMKTVLTFEMGLVVGNQDSGRKRKQINQLESQPFESTSMGQEQNWQDMNYDVGAYEEVPYDESAYPYYDDYGYDQGYDYGYDQHYVNYPSPMQQMIPPPEHQEELDEKTRLRRQEQLLLPSQPPQDGESSSAAIRYTPTAPDLSSVHFSSATEQHNDGNTTPSTLHTASSIASSTRSTDTMRPFSASHQPAPPPFNGTSTGDGDDKQELERRRLLAQASAPPAGAEAESSAPHAVPTAPMINEQDEYSVQTLNHDHSGPDLPQYER